MKIRARYLICGVLALSTQVQSEQINTISGYSGLDPNNDIYKLKTFNNNFVLPIYQTQSVNQAYYMPQNPNSGLVSETNFQFQFSLKYAFINQIFSETDALYFAYDQISNWQAYDKSAYFRDSQYQPQLFWYFDHSHKNTIWQAAAIGLEHQSNGKGGFYERSWNRVFVNLSLNFDDIKLNIKPWVRVKLTKTDYNSDIVDYMGHGEIRADWYLGKHQLSLTLRNLLESGFSRGYEEINWRFPIYKGLKGYLKLQSGYGFTVSDYNYYDNAIGIGFAI